MKLTIETNLKQFKTAFDLMNGFGPEAKMLISTTGVKFEMTSGGASLLYTSIAKEFFDVYECGSDDEFGIYISDLQKILKKTAKKISLETDNVMIVKSDSNTFKLPLISNAQGISFIPEVATTVSAEMEFQLLASTLDNLSTVGGLNLSLQLSNGMLVASTKNGQREASSPIMPMPDVTSVVKSTYSLDLLQPIAKKNSDKVTIKFGEQTPLILEYNSAHMSTLFMVAPRVTEE